jgi:hypothetical protein
MTPKRGKDTNCTSHGLALVDETYFPHGGCFSNRKFVRETPDLVTYMPLKAQRSTTYSANTKLRPLAMENVKQTHPMSGHHGKANRCPAAIRHL